MPKWIEFIEEDGLPVRKTKIFTVVNKETMTIIGAIMWYNPFRKYSFFPQPKMVFEATCLQDITDFIKRLMAERKLKKQ